MTSEPTKETADQDIEARRAIWKTVCIAADDVRHRFRVNTIYECERREARLTSNVPSVATWQLIEALSLLCVMLRCDDASATTINLFGRTGPIEIHEDGAVRHLWTQQTLKGERSELNGRPDVIVTSTAEVPNPSNAVRIIEVKCVKQLDTPTIRAEFGKAYDLRVATYFIWSFFTPTARTIAGAKGLGIDLTALGFDTERRADLVKSPEALIAYVAQSQDLARRVQRFATALGDAGEETRRKFLGPAR